jgi:hypothetical protein
MTRSSLLFLAIALLGACTTEPTTTRTMAAEEARLAAKPASPSVESTDLATLHAATARFHRYDEVAKDAGYTFLFMNMCMVDQSPQKLGGMGYHYVNTALLDDKVEVENPEALLYEPEANGRLRLVAVEYVIPADKWQPDTLPVLFGQKLQLNSFGLYALHVWAWENNPSGLYASWNPRVSCDNAAP